MAIATNLGFPRIGVDRELKRAQEAFWRGEKNEEALQEVAATLRADHWQLQKRAGIEHIPVNDFSLYDHVLDTIAMTGAIPPRYVFSAQQPTGKPGENAIPKKNAVKSRIDLDTYFAMARGKQKDGVDVVAMEITKWFDTNYHYIVPEFYPDTCFSFADDKIIKQFKEAKKQGIACPRPVLLGPVSFLLLGKSYGKSLDKLGLLPGLLAVYQEVLAALAQAGAEWVQIDEPCLVLDSDAATSKAYMEAYQQLAQITQNHTLKINADDSI